MTLGSLTLLLAALPAVTLPALVLAGGASGATTSSQESALASPPGIVDGKTARALVAAGAVVVDVRTPQEFAAGHVPGAKNIPYDQIRARAAEVGGPQTPVVLYCRTGRRSAIAIQTLKELGYEKLWDLQTVERWSEKAD
jgi:rhodanese-related sulfurtransferase